MEVEECRPRRTTLSEQLSAAAALELLSSASKISTSSSSPSLGDLLKVRQGEDLQQQQQGHSCRSASISLGTFLAYEKREPSSPGLVAAASSAATANGMGGRTLLDIIRDEDEESSRGGGGEFHDGVLISSGNSGHRISWRRAFKERLRIRRAGNPVDVASAVGPIPPSPAAASPSGIPVPEGNPMRAGTGDATRPTEPSTRMAAADMPDEGGGSAGDQGVGGYGRGGSLGTAAAGEAGQQHVQRQVRVSLMSLLDETERQEGGGRGVAVSGLLEGVEEGAGEGEEEEEEGKAYYVKWCCVCMVRHRGAAFIPCGHTFCRLCCRELWISRGNCPLCNGFILEVLDIF